MKDVVKKFLKKKPITMLVRSISMRLSARKKKDKDRRPSGITTSTSAHAVYPNDDTNQKLHYTQPISNIHRVKDVQLQTIKIGDQYTIERVLAEGCFAKILLAKHHQTQTTVVLKAIHQELTTQKDFQREYHYSYHLSPHPNVLVSYAVCFQAEHCFVFAQEHAPMGDLSGYVRAGGLSERTCKAISKQLASALDFMHSKQLVHRDIKLENVLVFDEAMSKVKICDFGETRKEGTLVSKPRCIWPAFVPPELYEMLSNERYHCKTTNDAWQLGILIFVCLTGCPPWQSADCIGDTTYANFWKYQKRRHTKIPLQFKRFTPRLLRMFRRMFEHNPEKRAGVSEVVKYLDDAWIDGKTTQQSGQSVNGRRANSPDSYLNQKDRSSDDAGKVRLRRLLSSYGLETTIDQKIQTKRVWDWVLAYEAQPDGSDLSPSGKDEDLSFKALPVC